MSYFRLMKDDPAELSREKELLVEFSSFSCVPCQFMAPVIEHFAAVADLPVASINADLCPAIAAAYNVRIFPSVYYLKNGEVRSMTVGLTDEEGLSEFVKRARGADPD